MELENNLTELEKQKKEIEIAAYEANEKIFEQIRNLAASESKILLLEEELEARVEDLGGMVRGEAVIAAEADSLRRRAESAEKTGEMLLIFHSFCSVILSYIAFCSVLSYSALFSSGGPCLRPGVLSIQSRFFH